MLVNSLFLPSPLREQAQLHIHLLGELNVELSCPQEAEKGDGIEVLRVTLLLQCHAELMDCSILLFGGVSRVAGLLGRRDGREIIVIWLSKTY